MATLVTNLPVTLQADVTTVKEPTKLDVASRTTRFFHIPMLIGRRAQGGGACRFLEFNQAVDFHLQASETI